MSLLKHTHDQRELTLHIEEDALLIDGFRCSDAVARAHACRTSFHCPGRQFVVQGSNLLCPDETSDDDWATIQSGIDSFANVEHLCKWIRVKGDFQPGDRIYCLSLANATY